MADLYGRIRAWFYRFSLGTRFEMVLVSIFICLAALSIGISNSITHSYERQLYLLNRENASRFAYIVDGSLQNIDVFGEYLMSDFGYQELLETLALDGGANAGSARRSLFRQLGSVVGTTPFVTDVAFELPSGEVIHSGAGYAEDAVFRQSVDEAAAAANGHAVWAIDGNGVLYYVREIRQLRYLSLTHLAYLYLRVDLSSLVADVNASIGSASSRFIILGPDRDVFFSDVSDEEYNEELFDSVHSSSEGYMVDGSYLISSGLLNDGQWAYLSFLDCSDLNRSLRLNSLGYVITISLLLFISCYLIHLMVSHILRHFGVLKDKMLAFSGGNMDMTSFPSYEGRMDEIGVLHHEFDHMVQDFDHLVKDNYIKQLMIKDNKIKMLNQQINPHFLYNVLDSIYWSAQCHGAEDIALMSYALARLFRISTADDSILVPLRKEIEYLEAYLDIQKLRFPATLFFSKEVDEQLLDVRIPRLSIQPLAENSIKHVIQEEDVRCDITLRVWREGELAHLSLSNTGSAFPEDIDRRLEDSIESDGHIGLRNINERLSLLFPEGGRLHFSNEGGLATVSFTVPIKEE